MAAIYDLAGTLITGGLQGCTVTNQAIRMAEEMADDMNKSVVLEDDDGDWVVHPKRDGVREAADLYDPDVEWE